MRNGFGFSQRDFFKGPAVLCLRLSVCWASFSRCHISASSSDVVCMKFSVTLCYFWLSVLWLGTLVNTGSCSYCNSDKGGAGIFRDWSLGTKTTQRLFMPPASLRPTYLSQGFLTSLSQPPTHQPTHPLSPSLSPLSLPLSISVPLYLSVQLSLFSTSPSLSPSSFFSFHFTLSLSYCICAYFLAVCLSVCMHACMFLCLSF